MCLCQPEIINEENHTIFISINIVVTYISWMYKVIMQGSERMSEKKPHNYSDNDDLRVYWMSPDNNMTVGHLAILDYVMEGVAHKDVHSKYINMKCNNKL